MSDPVIRAEGFIWLIVGVFWVIAQIAGAAAKKNRVPQGTENGDSPADPFADLLRKMAGAETFRAEPPESSGEPEPEFIAQSPWKPGDIEALPDIRPLHRDFTGPERAVQPVQVPEIDIRPKMSAFRASVPSIKMPAMTLNFRGPETSARKTADIEKILRPSDKKSLRRAMLSHIIFAPPRALEKNPAGL